MLDETSTVSLCASGWSAWAEDSDGLKIHVTVPRRRADGRPWSADMQEQLAAAAEAGLAQVRSVLGEEG